MTRNSLNRGTSVLAALVFVALLAGAAAVVSALGPAAPGSQTAQAATPSAPLPPSKPTPTEAACAAAKQKAADAKGQISVASGTGTKLTDNCVGAVYNPTKQHSQKNDPESYKCVGKSATVNIDAKGSEKVKAAADASVPTPGMCRTFACQTAANGKVTCISVSMAGYSSDKINNYLAGKDPDVQPFTVDKDKLSGLYDADGMPLDPRSAGGLDRAFSQQQAEAQTQYQQNDDAIKKIDQMIGECSSAESANCQGNVADLQKQRDELAAKQIELKSQMDSLAQARSDLSANNRSGAHAPQGQPDPARQPPIPPPDPRKDTFTPPPQAPQPDRNSGGGGIGGFLKSMLQGLAKGLSQPTPPQAPPCSSDPSAYAREQQQYNMQLQQYNLQLQQYNYQSQYAQLNGLTPPPPPVAPQSCQQTPASNTCPAAPTQPTGACNGSWRPVTTAQSNGSQCTTSWQCAPTGATQPSAQISCQPLIADVGMSIAIAYTCGNATGSQGNGFDTQSATSGSTSTAIAMPPAGINTATYGVQCANQSLTAKAECSIQIGRPSIVLVATPKIVASGKTATIGWITSGMKTCVVSSPTLADFTAQNATNTSVSGAATTPALTADADFLLHCATVGGAFRDATTTVQIATSTTP